MDKFSKYEQLIIEAENEGCSVWDKDIGSLEGLYVDGHIAINTNIDTDKRKLCVLAEEIGHHKTTYGDITDQTKVNSQKQEKQARRWAHNKLMPLESVTKAIKKGYTEIWQIAEHFDLDEKFVQEALVEYKLLDE